jgi:aquaporin Z
MNLIACFYLELLPLRSAMLTRNIYSLTQICRRVYRHFLARVGDCVAAVLAAGVPGVGIGWLGVSFAFGLTVRTMAYAIGHISECHMNPAVSVGLVVGGRFPAKEFSPSVVAQVLGGIAGSAVLFLIASGQAGFTDGAFLGQLWLFWLAPIVGAVLAGLVCNFIAKKE